MQQGADGKPDEGYVSLRVGAWRIDAGLNEISSADGATRRLEPRVMELLVYLAAHPGVTLSREQILDVVWQGASVVDGVLPRAVSELRSALGDDARDPRYVQTVPRRGYRLIAPVDTAVDAPVDARVDAEVPADPSGDTSSGDDSGPEPDPGRARRSGTLKPSVLVPAILALTLVVAVLLLATRRGEMGRDHAPSRAVASIAVLPLDGVPPPDGAPFFAEGMTDSLTASLARSRALRVVSAHSSLRQEDLDPQSAGARLGVDAVLVGSVVHEEGDVGLTLQLIATSDGTVLWAGRFRQPTESVLAVQSEIAHQVVREIHGEIGPGLHDRLADGARVVPEAFERTLEARYHLNQRSSAGILRSRELFQEALLADSGHAPAWAGLAQSYLQLANYQMLVPQQAYPAAREAAQRAIALDDSAPEAHTALGLTELHETWNLPAAEASYRRAIELGPSYTEARQLYAELLSFQGRHDEALREIAVARGLDPFSTLIQAVEGVILLGAGRYDESITRLDEAYGLDPSLLWTRRQRAYALERLGRHDEAARARAAIPHSDAEAMRRLQERVEVGGLQGYYRWALDEEFGPLESTLQPAALVAECFAGLGDDEQALRWIERAVEQKGEYLLHLQRSPAFDRIRHHPRFREPLEAAGVDVTIPAAQPDS